jgi:subtilisin family serine protease
VSAAVLMFVDPAELMLILGDNEILSWATRAASVSLGLALLAGLILVALSIRAKPRAAGTLPGVPAPLRLLGLVLVWIAASLVYLLGGQPGFHGDWLFVVLRDQADVSSAYNMPDRTQRLAFVYTTLVQHANTTQAPLRDALDRLHVAYHPYYLVNGLEVNGGPVLRAYLATRPEVDRVLDSPHLRPLPQPPGPMTGDQPAPTEPQWNITSIGADRVWRELNVTGQGIVVGQSDSGVQGDHPALQAGYRGLQGGDDYNWIDPWNHTAHPTDAGGHGTHTLGTAVGRGGIGVAPGAQWMACVNLARNLGNPPVYLNCMEFMLAPWPQAGDPLKSGDPSRAAHVINNSWGCPPLEGCDAGVLGPAVAALRAAGIFVVASAGNEGPYCGSIRDPIALYPGAFSVGAVDSSGTLANFSSRGPVTVDGSDRVKPDISAPGVRVLSALPHNAYGYEDGTSMAGPHVVGTVALMWSANPKLIGNIDQTAKILTETARPYTAPPDSQGTCPNGSAISNEAGHGLLDAYAAVAEAIKEK